MKITRRQLRRLIAEQVLLLENSEELIKAFLKANPDAKGKAIGVAKIRNPSKAPRAFSIATTRATKAGADTLKKSTKKQFKHDGVTYAVVYSEKA
mgnify:CR=1 FL=1